MYPFERKEKILNKLRSTGQIRINEGYKSLNISYATLHRDLEVLEKQGLVRKVRGGAILIDSSQFPTHFDIRMKTRIKEKEAIARNAAETIKDDTCIFLDHSSTTVFLAREIKCRHFRNLIVLTNSLVIPFEFTEEKGIQVILTGGVFESEFKALSGHWVIDFLRGFHIHQIFASVGAVSVEQGLMTQISFIHALFPELFNCGRQVNILVDSSKFFKIATFRIAPLKTAHKIFSDTGIPEIIKSAIEKEGPEVIV